MDFAESRRARPGCSARCRGKRRSAVLLELVATLDHLASSLKMLPHASPPHRPPPADDGVRRRRRACMRQPHPPTPPPPNKKPQKSLAPTCRCSAAAPSSLACSAWCRRLTPAGTRPSPSQSGRRQTGCAFVCAAAPPPCCRHRRTSPNAFRPSPPPHTHTTKGLPRRLDPAQGAAERVAVARAQARAGARAAGALRRAAARAVWRAPGARQLVECRLLRPPPAARQLEMDGAVLGVDRR